MINDDDDITLEDISVNKDCDDGLESTIIFDFVGLKFQGRFGWTLVNKFIDIGSKAKVFSFWNLFIAK